MPYLVLFPVLLLDLHTIMMIKKIKTSSNLNNEFIYTKKKLWLLLSYREKKFVSISTPFAENLNINYYIIVFVGELDTHHVRIKEEIAH